MASDRIIILDKGKIVEVEPHADLIKIEGGHYRKLWDAQIMYAVREFPQWLLILRLAGVGSRLMHWMLPCRSTDVFQ